MRSRHPHLCLVAVGLAMLLILLAAPVAAQTPCDSHGGRLADIHSRQQLKAFVNCAAEHIGAVGWEQAARDFETAAWRDRPVYLFAGTGEGKVILVAGVDVEPGADVLDRVDSDGAHVSHQHLRVLRDFGSGYVYYRFNNPVSGETEPKVTWITRVEYQGEPAYVGAGYYPTDTHASCSPDLVRASLVFSERDVERFVACAERHLQQRGLQALHDFNTDPRWISGPTYLFLGDMESAFAVVNAGQPHRVGTDGSLLVGPDGVNVGLETQRVLNTHDDGYVYYSFPNPATGEPGYKGSYVRRILLDGRAYVLGAGLYVPAAECRHLPPARDIDTRDAMQQFVRCAKDLVEERGEAAWDLFLNHPQWIGGATYLFVLDENCDYLAAPVYPAGVNNGQCDFVDVEGTPVDQEIRARVTSAEGEGWVSYVLRNPLNGEVEGKESYVVGVTLNDQLISVAAGLYESQMQG
ncbi:MAG: cache domain-containing protein [Anaerolineaceae bacterium]|nr:cache domain-containing protein [Anaerolineaceae bacterium]